MKICACCKVDREDSEFYKDKTLISGLSSWCRSCKYKSNRSLKGVNRYDNESSKRRRKKSIDYKLRCNLRTRLGEAIKRKYKSESALKLTGCSLDELKQHLESLFQLGMTWENYGRFGWHIDHKKPCSSFDLTNKEEQEKCFHYTNLQPLWWRDNLIKGIK